VFVSVITGNSAESLGLKLGDAASAIIKTPNVIIGVAQEGTDSSDRGIKKDPQGCGSRLKIGGETTTARQRHCLSELYESLKRQNAIEPLNVAPNSETSRNSRPVMAHLIVCSLTVPILKHFNINTIWPLFYLLFPCVK